MPRFFCPDIAGGFVRITGDDARHIAKSLRMRAGEEITVCDLRGSDYLCKITGLSSDEVLASVLEQFPTAREPRFELVLYQALPKADKLENIAQKAVELGVSALAPVITSRCVARWDDKDEAKKRGRLDKIMLEAAKQSGRGIIPRTQPLLRFEDAVLRMKSAALPVMFYEESKTPLRNVLKNKNPAEIDSAAVLIGSEGGFSPEEAAFAEQNGLAIASLGPRILRCETAPICAISALNFALGEF
jgi:16S rRNA (uracil1498-N3)-methyltransferase